MELVYIQLHTDTPAMRVAPATEIARILRQLADDFEQDGAPHANVLRDSNSEKIGYVRVDWED